MFNIPHSKIIGIYQIRCRKNSMVYIGQSEWIGARWEFHLATLMSGTHRNEKLQRDFDKYGVDAFSFSILEIMDNKAELDDAEIKWISKHRKSRLYNIRLLKITKDTLKQREEFLNEIDSLWVFSRDNEDKHSGLIWREKDKNWFIKNSIKCNLLNIKNKEVTFSKIMKFLENNCGYIVSTRRFYIEGKSRTCHVLSKSHIEMEKKINE